jgi:anti-sigma B factor antagonist
MGFSCTVRQVANGVALVVSGDVDLAVHAAFEAEIAKAWDGSSRLAIDLSQVTFLDSMGLRVLVQARQQAAENGSEFVLAGPSTPVLRVLDLAGVASIFSVVEPLPDVAEDPDPAV